jgi:CubicO group peptidase (beta-lactamase class C family)
MKNKLKLALVLSFAILHQRAIGQAPTTRQMDDAEQYSNNIGGQTFVVVLQGNIIRESYSNGGNANKLQLLGSGTKGFTGMIGAIAAYDGIIKLDTPVVEVLTEWIGDSLKSKITYRHLLTMSSGLEELKDQTAWTDFLDAKVLYPAGSTFIYGPDPNLFGLALQRKLGSEKVVAYMNRKLFQPLGIRVQWQGGFADGNPQLSGGAYVRANEWYKFGEFVRRMMDGTWNGPQILPMKYLQDVISGSAAYPAYGFYWWLKETVPIQTQQIVNSLNNNIHTQQIQPIINDSIIPNDFIMCRGAYGQCLYVVPSRELVVVRNGPTNPTGFYRDSTFLHLLFRSSPTSVQDHNINLQTITIYPNPANDMVFINDFEGEAITYRIYNPSGQIVLEGTTTNKSFPTNVLPTGFYTLIISDNKGVSHMKKLIINQ